MKNVSGFGTLGRARQAQVFLSKEGPSDQRRPTTDIKNMVMSPHIRLMCICMGHEREILHI